MNFFNKVFLSCVLSLFSCFLNAQTKKDSITEDYIDTNRLRYEDRVYKSNIKTVLLYNSTFILSPPLIDIQTGEQLQLTFDDLDGDYKSYWYTLVHCDAMWKPSDLMPQEYLTNFPEEQITGFVYSSGTMQKYTHYSWTFPNNNIKINKSGNYILKVYLDNNKDKLVLTRRFMVYSSLVTVTGNVHQGA